MYNKYEKEAVQKAWTVSFKFGIIKRLEVLLLLKERGKGQQ